MPTCRRCWRSPSRTSRISRSATAARCAARSPMRTRRRSCRCACWRCRAWCTCAARGSAAACRPPTSSPACSAPARAPDELVEAVSFPLPRAGEGTGFAEFSRRHGDYAVCAVAAVVRAGRLRLAAAGVADRPVALDLPMLAGAELDARHQRLGLVAAPEGRPPHHGRDAAPPAAAPRSAGRRASHSQRTEDAMTHALLARASRHTVHLELNGRSAQRRGRAAPAAQ